VTHAKIERDSCLFDIVMEFPYQLLQRIHH
jgi:hypothetical protein